MKENTTILPIRQSETIIDPLTELARQGARRMLAEALKAEADAFVASFANEQLEDGRQRIVRHGFGPERKIQTVLWMSSGPRCATGWRPLMGQKRSALPRTFCRNRRAARSAWTLCCLFFI